MSATEHVYFRWASLVGYPLSQIATLVPLASSSQPSRTAIPHRYVAPYNADP
ncbi:MAG: hypothetical protein IT211_08975 [Armatimonadetes bacterium]|nr:hypothetical protein [Armatimonadota bacterium]